MSNLLTLTAPFQAGGTSHWVVLGLTAALTLLMIALARCQFHRSARVGEWILAIVLVLQSPVNIYIAWQMGTLSAGTNLPCHLCDFASFIGAYALIKKRQLACELLYFWGIAGTMQGLLTPALTYDWPHPRFIVFFALHGGVVLAALYVVFGRRQIPRRGAVMTAFKLLLGYAALAGTADYFSGGNYGFLRSKPPTASILDQLGPWPWYIVSLLFVSLAIFTLLDLPFLRQRKRAH
ncbi:TIGR02206 family membrane protein [soil metagenome]